MSATGSRSDAGATLLEMLVVLGILGMVTALMFPAVVHPLQRMSQLQARASLASNLRLARAEAVRGGRAVVVDLAGDGGGYGWRGAAVVLPASLRVDGQGRSIHFFADGSSSGGRFWITGEGRREAVVVDEAGVVAAGAGG